MGGALAGSGGKGFVKLGLEMNYHPSESSVGNGKKMGLKVGLDGLERRWLER